MGEAIVHETEQLKTLIPIIKFLEEAIMNDERNIVKIKLNNDILM